jgi:hypothetical protein
MSGTEWSVADLARIRRPAERLIRTTQEAGGVAAGGPLRAADGHGVAARGGCSGCPPTTVADPPEALFKEPPTTADWDPVALALSPPNAAES